MPPRPTLKSMAATLGVHVSTVSRILNGGPNAAKGAASAELTERVRALARELNYRPNPQATSLRTQRSRDIGLLLPRLSDPLHAQLHEGLEAAARVAGYHVLACATFDDPQRSLEQLQRLLERPLAGVIVADQQTADSAVLTTLAEDAMPYLVLGRQLPGHPGIACDNRAAGRELAEHWQAAGRRQAGILAGHWGATVNGQECIEGFREAWTVAATEVLVEHSDNSGALLNQGVDALWALDDHLALGVYGTAANAGLAVGDGLALAGYHDLPWAARLPVPLTSVTVPGERMGRLALQMLLRHIEGKGGQPIKLTPQLQVRASG